jgi:hypothetical protein
MFVLSRLEQRLVFGPSPFNSTAVHSTVFERSGETFSRFPNNFATLSHSGLSLYAASSTGAADTTVGIIATKRLPIQVHFILILLAS